jgi:hypothetical protein
MSTFHFLKHIPYFYILCTYRFFIFKNIFTVVITLCILYPDIFIQPIYINIPMLSFMKLVIIFIMTSG